MDPDLSLSFSLSLKWLSFFVSNNFAGLFSSMFSEGKVWSDAQDGWWN